MAVEAVGSILLRHGDGDITSADSTYGMDPGAVDMAAGLQDSRGALSLSLTVGLSWVPWRHFERPMTSHTMVPKQSCIEQKLALLSSMNMEHEFFPLNTQDKRVWKTQWTVDSVHGCMAVGG